MCFFPSKRRHRHLKQHTQRTSLVGYSRHYQMVRSSGVGGEAAAEGAEDRGGGEAEEAGGGEHPGRIVVKSIRGWKFFFIFIE